MRGKQGISKWEINHGARLQIYSFCAHCKEKLSLDLSSNTYPDTFLKCIHNGAKIRLKYCSDGLSLILIITKNTKKIFFNLQKRLKVENASIDGNQLIMLYRTLK